MKQLILAPVMGFLLAFSSASASAATQTQVFSFGNLLTGSNGAPASGSFAKLSISTSDHLSFTFDLQILGNLNTVFDSGAFVSELKVNTNTNDAPTSSTISSGGSWGVAEVRQITNPSNAGSISWDFQNDFCGNGNGNSCNPGNNASARLTAGEQVKWVSVFAAPQNQLLVTTEPGLLLHVQGFAAGSGQYTAVAVVPEPETWAMMLAGLGLIGGLAKRRRDRSAG